MKTTFLLNEIETDCTLGQIIFLESLQWSIENEFGKVNHLEYMHTIKNQIKDDSGWNTLGNNLKVSDMNIIPVEEQTEKPDEGQDEFYYKIIDGVKEHTHVLAYCTSTTIIFLISAVLLCIYRNQVK